MGGVMGAVEDLTGLNVSGDSSSDRALRDQQAATGRANSMQERMFNTQREDAAPWREAGVTALGGMQDKDYQRDFTMSDFQADPGYDFRMKEGMKAIERSAAARGGRHGGATMKALVGYGQDVASSEYQNAYNRFNADRDRRFNRLGSIAGVGQTANSQVAAAGQNYANQYGANETNMANARAGQAMGQAGQLGNAIGQGTMAYLAFSDERLKENIKPVSKSDLAEMRKNLKAYTFQYKSDIHGRGEFVGVMAQDLEKSKLGKTLVFEDSHGHKQIDLARVLMLFLATMAEA